MIQAPKQSANLRPYSAVSDRPKHHGNEASEVPDEAWNAILEMVGALARRQARIDAAAEI